MPVFNNEMKLWKPLTYLTTHTMSQVQVAYIGVRSFFNKTCCFLLKQSKHIKSLNIYDDENIKVGLDIAKMSTNCRVRCYRGRDHLPYAVRNADIVVIGEQYLDIPINNDMVFSAVGKDLIEYASIISQYAPKSLIVVATSPINSTLPLVSLVMEACGCCDCNRIMGVTSHDSMRANSVLANYLKISPHSTVLPVIGGSSTETRVPLFSQAKPCTAFKKHTMRALATDIKTREEDIIRNNKSSEVNNRAYGLIKFVHSVIAGLQDKSNVIDIALTRSVLIPGTEFFSMPLLLGKKGISYRFGLPRMSSFEIMMVECALESICKDIDRAELFFKNRDTTPGVEETYSDFLNKFQKKSGGKGKDEYSIYGNKVKLKNHLVAEALSPSCEPKYLPQEDDCNESYPIYNPPPVTPRHMPPHSPHSSWLKASIPKVCSERFEKKKPCENPEPYLSCRSPCQGPFRVTFDESIAYQAVGGSSRDKYEHFTVMGDAKLPSPMLSEESSFSPIHIPLYISSKGQVKTACPSSTCIFPTCSPPYMTPCPHQSAHPKEKQLSRSLPPTNANGPFSSSQMDKSTTIVSECNTNKQMISLEVPPPSFSLLSWLNTWLLKFKFIKQEFLGIRNRHDSEVAEYLAALKAKEEKKKNHQDKICLTDDQSKTTSTAPQNNKYDYHLSLGPREKTVANNDTSHTLSFRQQLSHFLNILPRATNEEIQSKEIKSTQEYTLPTQQATKNPTLKRSISCEAHSLGLTKGNLISRCAPKTDELTFYKRKELDIKPCSWNKESEIRIKPIVFTEEIMSVNHIPTRHTTFNENLVGAESLPSFVGFDCISSKLKAEVAPAKISALSDPASLRSKGTTKPKTIKPSTKQKISAIHSKIRHNGKPKTSISKAQSRELVGKVSNRNQWKVMDKVFRKIQLGTDPVICHDVFAKHSAILPGSKCGQNKYQKFIQGSLEAYYQKKD